MMENYEQEDYSSSSSSCRRMKGMLLEGVGSAAELQLESAHAEFITVASTTVVAVDGEQHKQNFDFGAEIVLATQQPQHSAQGAQDKASLLFKNKASTTKEQIDTAMQMSQKLAMESERDDEGDDSFQTDDDDEEEEENAEHKQNSSSALGSQEEGASDDDSSSSDSDFSDLSGLSDMSGREWKPISARPINWVQRQIHSGANPRELLSQMLPTSSAQQLVAPGLNDMTLWRILASLIAEPPRRQKLRDINTFDDVVQLIERSANIVVLTGAGVSVSCGIPDFRSSDGIYSRLAKDFPDLPDPQAMFDIAYFSRDPRPFYRFAREIYPGQFKPSPCHRFIKLLEAKGKLLRNYTQNIDTLEQVAGIERVIECHGSFATASCTKCRRKCGADAIRADIFAQRIPVCTHCQPNVQQSIDALLTQLDLKQLVENGIMKPDIVFFGEGLPQEFHTVMASDKDKCDLLIVMGSSLKVRPVALIPSSIPPSVPQILINREQLHHLAFDVELLGDSDVIINQLCHRLGDIWQQQICYSAAVLKESKELLPLEIETLGTSAVEEEEADTQSVKSNASTDIALRSDSGFESSTSSGVAVPALPTKLLAADFVPFSARLSGEKTLVTSSSSSSSSTANYRHLSVDSSKDSGIQCDSSNSAQATAPSSSSSAQLLPPVSNFGDSGGTNGLPPACGDANAAAMQPKTAATALASGVVDLKGARTAKRQSAAERLIEGTYYCHESSASYVFPGAQVSWSSDTEGDDEPEEEEEAEDECGLDGDDEEEDEFGIEEDTNGNGPLSPLMPPSVEAEMVHEITTTAAAASVFGANLTSTSNNNSNSASSTNGNNNSKRQASVPIESLLLGAETTDAATLLSNSVATAAPTPFTAQQQCSPPPLKRRRSSSSGDDDGHATPTTSPASNNTSLTLSAPAAASAASSSTHSSSSSSTVGRTEGDSGGGGDGGGGGVTSTDAQQF